MNAVLKILQFVLNVFPMVIELVGSLKSKSSEPASPPVSDDEFVDHMEEYSDDSKELDNTKSE
uniref:Uncharacterized protein n=1 Tax=Dulem virus 235 TaxID=3145712 RepID=A0AAU8B623_9VIRU